MQKTLGKHSRDDDNDDIGKHSGDNNNSNNNDGDAKRRKLRFAIKIKKLDGKEQNKMFNFKSQETLGEVKSFVSSQLGGISLGHFHERNFSDASGFEVNNMDLVEDVFKEDITLYVNEINKAIETAPVAAPPATSLPTPPAPETNNSSKSSSFSDSSSNSSNSTVNITVRTSFDQQTDIQLTIPSYEIDTLSFSLLVKQKAESIHKCNSMSVLPVYEIALSTPSTDIEISQSKSLSSYGISQDTLIVFASISQTSGIESSSSWQPFNNTYIQSSSALSNLVSTLYVVHHKLDTQEKEKDFLASVASILPYPPALRAIKRLLIAKSIDELAPCERQEITSTFIEISRVFLKSQLSIGFCNTKSLLDNSSDIMAWILAMPNHLWEENEVVITNSKTNFVSGNTSSSSSSSTKEPLVTTSQPDHRSNETQGWLDTLSNAWGTQHGDGHKKDKHRRLIQYPSMSLRNLSSKCPLLTYNENKVVVVYVGIPGCSNGVVEIWEPFKGNNGSGNSRQVSPDLLAKSLSSSGIAANLVDAREAEELLVVVIDTSNSMRSKAFEQPAFTFNAATNTIAIDQDGDDEMYQPAAIPVSAKDARDAAIKIRCGKWGKVLQASLDRNSAEEVFESMALICFPDDEWHRQATDQHADVFLRVLKTPDSIADQLLYLSEVSLSSSSTSTSSSSTSSSTSSTSLLQELSSIGGDFRGSSFDVFIVFGGQSTTMTVYDDWTVRRLHTKVAAKLQIPLFALHLSHNSKKMSGSHKLLREFSIKKSHNIQAKPRHSVADYLPSKSWSHDRTSEQINLSTGINTYKMSSAQSAEDLAIKICTSTYSLPHQFALWCNLVDQGDQLSTGTCLFDLRQPRQNSERLDRRIEMSSSTGSGITKQFEIKMYDAQGDPREKERYMDRLTCVKQLFENFINRLQAYGFPMGLALVEFGTKVNLSPFTNMTESFRARVEQMDTNGGTALFEAISESADLVVAKEQELVKRHAATDAKQEALTLPKKRILVMSDGDDQDSPSRFVPESILRKLLDTGVILDVIVIGGKSDGVLKSISLASGGLAFEPSTIEEAMKLTEHETLVFSGDRPSKNLPSAGSHRQMAALINAASKQGYHQVNNGEILARNQPIELERAAATLQSMLESMDSSSSSQTSSMDPSTRRIMKEYRNIIKQKNEHYDIYTFDNVRFATVVMDAPHTEGVSPEEDQDCLYAGATFCLYIKFPEDFPSRPPEIRFMTPITHVNVNSHGRICHGILGRDWNPRINIKHVLDCIYGLLLHPDIDDALDSQLAYLARQSPNTQYVKHVKQNLSVSECHRSREEWKRVMLKEN